MQNFHFGQGCDFWRTACDVLLLSAQIPAQKRRAQCANLVVEVRRTHHCARYLLAQEVPVSNPQPVNRGLKSGKRESGCLGRFCIRTVWVLDQETANLAKKLSFAGSIPSRFSSDRSLLGLTLPPIGHRKSVPQFGRGPSIDNALLRSPRREKPSLRLHLFFVRPLVLSYGADEKL